MSFADSLAALIRDIVGPVDYLAHHPATVVAQAANGTVEVRFDSPRMPSLKGVPLVLGLPGVVAKVAAGARVRVAFAGGSPDAPEATLWEAGGLVELVVTASTKVTVNAPQVLLGDGLKQPVCVGDTLVGLIAPPGGGAVTGSITSVSSPGTTTKVKV